jgi:hypothetical protein
LVKVTPSIQLVAPRVFAPWRECYVAVAAVSRGEAQRA